MSDYWYRQLKEKLIEGTEMGKIGDVHINQFAGGKEKGLSVQLTSGKGDGYVQLTKDEAKELAQRLMKWSSSDKPALPGEFESVREAVGDYAEPIYDLIDELGDSSIVLDNLIRYLDGDQIKDFVDDFRRHHDMPKAESIEEKETPNKPGYCSDECCGADVKAEDCDCAPDCDGCDCNAKEGVNEDMNKKMEVNKYVDLAMDSIWDKEKENPAKVFVSNITIMNPHEPGGYMDDEPDDGYRQVNVEHDGPWTIYTDSGFAQEISGIVGFEVDFTEQGMQQDGSASMEGEMKTKESKEESTMEQLERILKLAGLQRTQAKAPVEEESQKVAEDDISEDDIEEGSIKYMHSLKAKGKSMEEIAKELDMSVEEVKQAMSKTNESVESTEEVIEEAEDKMPTKADIMKCCEDGMSKEECCKKYSDCDQDKIKKMYDDCKDEMKEKEEVKEETLEESPTMDTTQLIHLLKLSGVSEEKITEHIEKLSEEWGNTPDSAGETEPTEHGSEDNYNFAQMVNLSLKRYLDAQDMKVSVNESHTVEGMKAKYDAMKNK